MGVLDVGSFSARLVAVPAGGTPTRPAVRHKTRLRLDRALDGRGRIDRAGIAAISHAVAAARRAARDAGVSTLFPLATSSIRDAANNSAVVRSVAADTGVELRSLSGRREAELAFVAARRWYGAAGGPLVVLDVGGGTVEIAAGAGEHASMTRSLRLGARELTRTWLGEDLASAERVAHVREHTLERVRDALAGTESMVREGMVVGCSKVLQQLARLAGARPQRDGLFVERGLHVDDLRRWIPRLAKMPPSRRAELPGISRCRSRQALAGAIVAEALLSVVGARLTVCPWSTTEGLLLGLLDDVAAGQRPAGLYRVA
ncbi:exopolyphosphatase [Amycolatopsis suaedae]|uniref:Exopolyphosphatase n=1 Tax=Amycolatopsis suaedae TaxID=2510978 RepID=A0A4Q7IYG9_9PSEU|nr:exopolyphosphatase [Amycolatopsis suaedae]